MFIGRYSDQLWVLFNGVAAYFDFVMFIGMLGVMLGLTTVLPLRKMSLGHSSSVSSLATRKSTQYPWGKPRQMGVLWLPVKFLLNQYQPILFTAKILFKIPYGFLLMVSSLFITCQLSIRGCYIEPPGETRVLHGILGGAVGLFFRAEPW